MEKNTKKPEEKQQQAQLPEAPATATVKIKSTAGFEYLFTLRDEKASNLMFKIAAMEKKWLELGWTPLAQQTKGGFPQKQIDYVPNRTCPTCGSRLVRATTKDGKKMIKCETNKWNFTLKRSEGCPFIEWEQPRIPERQINDDYGEY